MNKLPALTGGELLNALLRTGFTVVRIRESHHFARHSDGRATVVAVHAGETIGPGLMAKMLRDLAMSREELASLL